MGSIPIAKTDSEQRFPLRHGVATLAFLLVAVCSSAAPVIFLGALLTPGTFVGALFALYAAAMARDTDLPALRRLIAFVLLLAGIGVLAMGAEASGALIGDKLLEMSKNRQFFWSWPPDYNRGFAFWLGAPTLLTVGIRMRKRLTVKQATWTWLYWFTYFPATMLMTVFDVDVLNMAIST